MTSSPDSPEIARLLEVQELLLQEGCSFAEVFFDGPELVIHGCAPSYEVKRRLETIVGELVGHPIRNSMRVYPT